MSDKLTAHHGPFDTVEKAAKSCIDCHFVIDADDGYYLGSPVECENDD